MMSNYDLEGYGIVNNVELDQKYINLIKKLSQKVPKDCKEIFGRYDRRSYLRALDEYIAEDDCIDGAVGTFYDYLPLDFLARYLNYKFDCVGFYAPTKDDENNLYGLLYSPLYPWEGKEGDHKITKDVIDAELLKVAKALDWDVKPDKQKLHYCG